MALLAQCLEKAHNQAIKMTAIPSLGFALKKPSAKPTNYIAAFYSTIMQDRHSLKENDTGQAPLKNNDTYIY